MVPYLQVPVQWGCKASCNWSPRWLLPVINPTLHLCDLGWSHSPGRPSTKQFLRIRSSQCCDFPQVGVVMRYLGQFPSELTPRGWPLQPFLHRRCANFGVESRKIQHIQLNCWWLGNFITPKAKVVQGLFLFADPLTISPSAPSFLGQMGPRMTPLRSDLKETIIPELLEEDPSSLSLQRRTDCWWFMRLMKLEAHGYIGI